MARVILLCILLGCLLLVPRVSAEEDDLWEDWEDPPSPEEEEMARLPPKEREEYKEALICPKVCTRQLQFICAKNSKGKYKTFDNPCYLKGHNCDKDDDFVMQYDGACLHDEDL